MTQKMANASVIFVFFMLILFPLVFSNKVGGEKSETENRYLATFPELFTKEMKIIPGWQAGLENWINDNAGFRSQIQKIYSNLIYQIFHESPSDQVKTGEDGWYFYTGGYNLEISTGNYPLTPELLEDIRKNQEKIYEALKKNGIEYVIILVPSKVSVYPEYLPGRRFMPSSTVIDVVSDYLIKNTQIPVINVKEDLIIAKKSEIVFFKTDTHWNDIGAYIGYSSIINKLKHLGLIQSDPIKITTYQSTWKGEFSAMMGDNNLLPAEIFKATHISSQNALRLQSGPHFNNMQELKRIYNISNGIDSYKNVNAEKKRVLVFGDSFFTSIAPLMAENFSDFDFIWSDMIRANIVDTSKPDVVMLERTERAIYTLANPLDYALINEPLTNPSAQIISTNTPNEIDRRGKYTIRITVKNTGKENWSEENAVRLCILQDGQDYGFRVLLPEDVMVKPGEKFTFETKNFQTPPNDSFFLEYQMVQEGFQYFGEKKRVDITTKRLFSLPWD